MAGCGVGLTKVILNIFNGLLFLVGLVPLIFGIIALASEDVLNQILDAIPGAEVAKDIITNSAVYLLVIGIVVCIVAGLGLFGTCQEKDCLLYMYLAVLLVIIAAEVIILVLALAYPDTFSSGTQKVMVKSLTNLKDCTVNPTTTKVDCIDTAMSLAWHAMQYELRCCGAKDLFDYTNVTWVRRTSDSIAPLTCCRRNSGESFPPANVTESSKCYEESSIPSDYFDEGCFYAVFDLVTSSAIVIGILAGIGALELVLVASTMIQICYNKDR